MDATNEIIRETVNWLELSLSLEIWTSASTKPSLCSGSGKVILQQMFCNNTTVVWPKRNKKTTLLTARIVEFSALSLLDLKTISKFDSRSFGFPLSSLIRVREFFIDWPNWPISRQLVLGLRTYSYFYPNKLMVAY